MTGRNFKTPVLQDLTWRRPSERRVRTGPRGQGQGLAHRARQEGVGGRGLGPDAFLQARQDHPVGAHQPRLDGPEDAQRWVGRPAGPHDVFLNQGRDQFGQFRAADAAAGRGDRLAGMEERIDAALLGVVNGMILQGGTVICGTIVPLEERGKLMSALYMCAYAGTVPTVGLGYLSQAIGLTNRGKQAALDVSVEVNDDGTVTARVGTSSHGQGHETVFPQIWRK